jgi:hypothetical protein
MSEPESLGEHRECGGDVYPEEGLGIPMLGFPMWRCDKCKYLWTSEPTRVDLTPPRVLVWLTREMDGSRYTALVLKSVAKGLERVTLGWRR